MNVTFLHPVFPVTSLLGTAPAAPVREPREPREPKPLVAVPVDEESELPAEPIPPISDVY